MALKHEEKIPALPVTIRPMLLADLKAVYKIERESYPRPWPLKCFLDELTKNRFARYMVAEARGRIVGYAGMWVIAGETHITNIAVDQDYRRRKIGEQLLVDMIDFSLAQHAGTLYLEVRRYNIAAQRLYTRYSFIPTRVREQYYHDNGEDAIELRIPDTSDPTFLSKFTTNRAALIDAVKQSAGEENG